MKRALAHLFCAALLVGQVALPVAHEWRVALDEKGHHLVEARSGPVFDDDADSHSKHRHHGEDCGVCPCASKLKQAAAHAPASSVAVVSTRLMLPVLAAALPGDAAAPYQPRGPPQA